MTPSPILASAALAPQPAPPSDDRTVATASPQPETAATPASSPAGTDASACESATQESTPTASQTSPSTQHRLYDGLSWSYCGPARGRNGGGAAPPGSAALPPAPTKQEPIDLSADSVTYDEATKVITLRGDVQVERGSEEIMADEITYNRRTGDVVADGNAYFTHPGVRAVGTHALVNLSTDRGTLTNTHYRLTGPINARGSADQADLLSRTSTRFSNVTYTTCQPGQNAWSLEASKLDLDQVEGMGVARDAKLRVLGVPMLYTPYISFPIDDRRRSGFLIPSIGTSNSKGFQLTVPYYWNIAPTMDATFYPMYMAKRGVMLGTEFRYLSPVQQVELYGEGMANDKAYSTNSPRGAFRLEQNGQYGSHWSSAVNFNYVSDDQYLQDFGNRLEVTSARNIERRGDLVYTGNGWSLLSRVRDFQTVDPTIPAADRPYAQLPQLLLSLSPYRSRSGVEAGLGGEYDYFYQPATVYGQRLAVQPYVSWVLRRPYGYLRPRVNLYQTAYLLDNAQSGDPTSPSHTIPSLNVDGRLVFERNVDWLGRDAVQTLEPRLYYLLTPYVDQGDTPVFDSSELTFSFASLFRPNRFTGRDRIGDANQLTVGLTSRTLGTASGYELFSASVGQILYFRNRDVQIAGPPQTSTTSSVAGELSARFLPNWSGRASLQWNPNTTTDQWEKRAVELHYETPEHRLVNLAYRFDVGDTEATRYEDTDLAFQWPVNRQLGLVGRWFYSLLYNETMEAFAGLEYGKCCWRVRLLGRHIKTSPTSSGNTSVMLQVELAGLGAFGNQINRYLERSIYGYHAD